MSTRAADRENVLFPFHNVENSKSTDAEVYDLYRYQIFFYQTWKLLKERHRSTSILFNSHGYLGNKSIERKFPGILYYRENVDLKKLIDWAGTRTNMKKILFSDITQFSKRTLPTTKCGKKMLRGGWCFVGEEEERMSFWIMILGDV